MAARAAVFEPISSIAAGGGPIHVRPASSTRRANARVLGEEAVAGVHCFGPGPERGLDEDVCAEIALGGRARADEVRLVGRARVRAPPIGLRVDGDAPDPELPQGPEDPDRDLATVRDEHLRERRGGVGRHDARILPQP